MARIFEDIHLAWGEETGTIPSDRVMGAIARIEQHITLPELYDAGASRKMPPLTLLAAAYGSVLRYAGLAVSDAEVYAGLFDKTRGEASLVVTAVQGLMEIMIPPDALKAARKARDAPKGSAEGNASPAAAKRSSRRTRPRSASGA
jgi:hypothetical protein